MPTTAYPVEQRVTGVPAQRDTPAGPAEAAVRLLDSFEREQRDVTERLHRGVLQGLVGARYLFDLAANADGRTAEQALELGREALAEALAEARSLLRDITPRVHDRLTLVAESGALDPLTVTSAGELELVSPVAATTYRLLQAVAATGLRARVELADLPADEAVGQNGSVRLTVCRLTSEGGSADRDADTIGQTCPAAFSDPVVDRLVERLRLAGARMVRDNGLLLADLPALPRLPVQQGRRTGGRSSQSTGISERATRRSKGTP